VNVRDVGLEAGIRLQLSRSTPPPALVKWGRTVPRPVTCDQPIAVALAFASTPQSPVEFVAYEVYATDESLAPELRRVASGGTLDAVMAAYIEHGG